MRPSPDPRISAIELELRALRKMIPRLEGKDQRSKVARYHELIAEQAKRINHLCGVGLPKAMAA
jgi:hypothetical protein